MIHECEDGPRRQRHRSPAGVAFGLHEDQAAAALPLKGTAHRQATAPSPQLNASASLIRSRVVASSTHSGYSRCSAVASNRRLTCSSLSVCMSRRLGRGTATASAGLRQRFADRLLVASGADSIEASQTSLQAAEAVSVELVQVGGGQLVLPARKFVEAVNFPPEQSWRPSGRLHVGGEEEGTHSRTPSGANGSRKEAGGV